MHVRIRDATRHDLPRIIEIERLAFDHPWSLESFLREFSLPFSRLIVAMGPDNNGGSLVVGFLCRWLVADECHILNVAVPPERRRQGIAKMMMAAAIDEAKAKNIRLGTLEERRSNLGARGLYRELKIEERRLRRNYYGPGEDAIVMELRIGSGPK